MLDFVKNFSWVLNWLAEGTTVFTTLKYVKCVVSHLAAVLDEAVDLFVTVNVGLSILAILIKCAIQDNNDTPKGAYLFR